MQPPWKRRRSKRIGFNGIETYAFLLERLILSCCDAIVLLYLVASIKVREHIFKEQGSEEPDMSHLSDYLFIVISEGLEVRDGTSRRAIVLHDDHVPVEPLEVLVASVLAIGGDGLLGVADYSVFIDPNQVADLLLDGQQSLVDLVEETPVDRESQRRHRRHLVQQVELIL
jgi:hypothetical protein